VTYRECVVNVTHDLRLYVFDDSPEDGLRQARMVTNVTDDHHAEFCLRGVLRRIADTGPAAEHLPAWWVAGEVRLDALTEDFAAGRMAAIQQTLQDHGLRVSLRARTSPQPAIEPAVEPALGDEPAAGAPERPDAPATQAGWHAIC